MNKIKQEDKMSTVSKTTRQRIEAQGYLNMSDATLSEELDLGCAFLRQFAWCG